MTVRQIKISCRQSDKGDWNLGPKGWTGGHSTIKKTGGETEKM